MFTIKEASARTGVPAASLRAWERRYHVVEPRRTESGYRMYDEQAIATLNAMRRLVDEGWSPAAAASAVSAGELGAPDSGGSHAAAASLPAPEAESLTEAFLDAASAVDVISVEGVLDQAFALGPFETVADAWLMPTLYALGEAWAEGRVDVAGEHAASYAVMRRLSQAFAAASSLTTGPRLVVGLPAGSHHELGALAFATAARRRGLAVVYVGADLPVESWQRAVRAFPTRMVVLAVPTAADRAVATATAKALLESAPAVIVAAGGAHADDLAPRVVRLPMKIADAARFAEELSA
jgi:DNA-binding transcriptional MerR regulator